MRVMRADVYLARERAMLLLRLAIAAKELRPRGAAQSPSPASKSKYFDGTPRPSTMVPVKRHRAGAGTHTGSKQASKQACLGTCVF